VVSAGEISTIVSGLSSDLPAVADDVRAMVNSEDTSLYNGIERAASLLDSDPARTRTIVVIAGGPDTSSTSTADAARSRLVQKGIQLVSVSFDGGDPGIDAMPTTAGGYVVSTSDDSQVGAAIASAVAVARDRLIISYDGVTANDRTLRGDVALTVGDLGTRFTHSGGVFEDHLVALAPAEIVEQTGLAFFRSQNGLYTAIGLSFIAAAMLVWALGNLFAVGDTSLESMLNRYSQGGEAALEEGESTTVQTALVKRAVEMSETFAQDKGFLIKIEGSLERARLPLRAGEAMGIFSGVVLLAAILGLFLTGGIFGALILAVILGSGMIFAVRYKARKRMRNFEKQLPDTLQLLAGTLRAGYSLPQGLEAVSKEITDPMGYELRRVMTEARLGRELEDSLSSTAERLESDDFAWAVMAISIQREVGGNLNELLMTVSDTMVARERLHGEVAALTAEGKLSAVILGMLPPGLGLVMYVMNAAYIEPLFTTTMGKALIGVALTLMTIGMGWMKKVITINV
jgi:tight adherence protein B